MLEFIVLGQVPGTHIELTFFQVLTLAEVFILLWAVSHEVRSRQKLLCRFLTPGIFSKAK